MSTRLITAALWLVLLCLSTPLAANTLDAQTLGEETRHWQQQTNSWQSRLQDARAQLQRLQANDADLRDHILALSGTVDTYRVLQQQRAALPTVTTTPGLADAIAHIRLRQFELTQQQRQAAEIAQDPQRASRNLLLSQLQTALNTAAELQRTQTELVATSTRLRRALQEELFWIPSNQPLTLSWWWQMPGRVVEQIRPGLGRLHLWPDWHRVSFWQWLVTGVLLALAALILWARKPLRVQLTALRDRVTAFQRTQMKQPEDQHYAVAYPAHGDDDDSTSSDTGDALTSPATNAVPSLWATPGVLMLLAAQAAPLSLVLVAMGNLLSTPQSEEVMSFGPALMALAFSLFVLQFLGRLLQDRDVTGYHLGWDDSQRTTFQQFVRHFAWVLLPTTFILALAQQQTLALTEDNVGVLVLVAAGLAIAYLFKRLLRQTPVVAQNFTLYWALSAVLVLLPLGLVALTAMGYYYTSLQLTLRVVATFYVLTGWVIAEATVMQGVILANEALRRRWAAEDAAQAALLQTDETGETSGIKPGNERRLELEKVTQQARRLKRFLLIVVFGSLLWLVWGDLVSVLGGLNEWVLWGGGALGEALPVSPLEILTAVLIIVLTLFLAANLPGLLEMSLLSRMQLQTGSAYAITTLLNYIITGTGLVLALASLGVSWDKLQWLVAALSVGLGFGLQEIFANFVSGLIILFERPVRIGDVVTLGNLSGRVREIRIRATTITDFDRKDIIVPNKTFVTGQLVNWSLTDTVTRVTVRVGVAYGSDLEKTRTLLLAAADENSRVLQDPAPQVLFLSFGASSLDHELRIHVAELKDRNPAIDEINRRIDQTFRDADIEISFQQVDIRLRNSEGLERIIEQRPRPAS